MGLPERDRTARGRTAGPTTRNERIALAAIGLITRRGDNWVSVFLSTFENKVDGKGRVSVPAPFRSALDKQNSTGLVLFPSLRHDCLEGCGDQRIEQIVESIDRLDAFSEEAEALQTMLADSVSLAVDGDGRIVLPEKMITFAGLDKLAVFVGQGRQFQIWSPTRYRDFRDHNRQVARDRGLSLRMVPRGTGEDA